MKRSLTILANPILVLAAVTAAVAAGVGFAYPVGLGWTEELIDYGGIALALIGSLLSAAARNRAEVSGARPRWETPGHWAVAAGLAFILGQAPIGFALTAVFGVFLFHDARTGFCSDRRNSGSNVWQCLRRTLVAEGRLLAWVLALCLLLEMWEHAVAPGGYKVHAGELAVFGCLLALVCVGLASSAADFGLGADGGSGPSTSAARDAFTGGALCLTGFAALGVAVGWEGLQRFDHWFIHSVYKCGDLGFTQLMRGISNAGGRDLALYWVPAIILGLCVARRRHAVGYFSASMVGTLGLETLFKTMVHRPRPDFTHGIHLDSFPSGHALAATILAGTLLLIWRPACARPWQRVVVWAVASIWPLAVAASRVYLGRHYLTDVTAGILLGAAWVQLCYAFVLSLKALRSAHLAEAGAMAAA